MSKKTMKFVSSVLVLVLLVSCWMLFYKTQKTNDNLPALEQLFSMEEEEANKTLCGYQEHQLLEVWGRATYSGAQELIWVLEDGVLLVNSDAQGEIVGCGLKKTGELPVLSQMAEFSDGELTMWLQGRFENQVSAIWGAPESKKAQVLTWYLPRSSPHAAIQVETMNWGKILTAEFID